MKRCVWCLLALALLVGSCGRSDNEVAPEERSGAPRAEVVEFTTPDGITLNALLFGSGDTVAVLAHMQGSNKEAWTDVAVALANNGFAAFIFDFRGYAGQEGEQDTNLDVDLTAAITAARAEGAANVFVVGASMGGTAAVDAAAQHKLDGVVAVSAPAQFGDTDALAAASMVEEPALFIAAADDHPAVDDAAALAQAAGGRFVSYEGDAHGTALVTEHRAKLAAQIVRFVSDPYEELGAVSP